MKQKQLILYVCNIIKYKKCEQNIQYSIIKGIFVGLYNLF